MGGGASARSASEYVKEGLISNINRQRGEWQNHINIRISQPDEVLNHALLFYQIDRNHIQNYDQNVCLFAINTAKETDDNLSKNWMQ